ncbi:MULTISPECIES: M20/M25/M40 family metallo-hydrolase [Pseudomonas fluorescens group]|uniref:M20/M25/M40 family metallo-hydrolase n=1 Tax=Pseudomonas fluorescens group TaxID=136843 RepID=UPI00087C5107|nr:MULTISPECIES: M20/M25/M40 family metallo-hydrolase [Pseudomonas fluorescens group]SDU51109.1 amidohydrolase [Pseudomonas moraviensis]
MHLTRIAQTILLTLVASHAGAATMDSARTQIAEQAQKLEPELLETRRDLHAHPELGNTEKRTAELVAKQLQAMGLEVKTGVARTGVVAILKGALPGPTVALRADMDALPVKEVSDLPFASKAKGTYLDKEVDVMHAWAGVPAGQIAYRPGPTLASSDDLRIKIHGKQTHAGRPWDGIDPITVGAQTIVGLQTVVSRRTDISSYPSVVSIGTINGGTRYNIIPESLDMTGTIRSYDYGIRQKLHADVRQTIEKIAESGGAKADVTIIEKYDPTINNPALTEKMLPTLKWAAKDDVVQGPLVGGAEDFSFFAKEAPGLFVFLGVTPRDQDMSKAAPNHNPGFFVDESALVVGVRTLASLATDYLYGNAGLGK